jgi:23S rRNA (guanosine2251-2'-O)-methyltransferase
VETLAGRNSVREALVAGRRGFERVTIAEGASEQGLILDILHRCREAGIPVARPPRRELDRLGDELTHQGVVAQVSDYPYVGLDEVLLRARSAAQDPLLLVLDELQDPQNIGALLRTAEAVGVHGVIIATHRAAQITPAVSRASAGAAEHLHVCAVTNIARTLEGLRDNGLWIAGVEDRPESQDYRRADLLGSEGQGMRRLVAKQCDYLLRLPMRGRITSLNVSVAGAIVLYRALDAREGA